jgi:hypothetical protein
MVAGDLRSRVLNIQRQCEKYEVQQNHICLDGSIGFALISIRTLRVIYSFNQIFENRNPPCAMERCQGEHTEIAGLEMWNVYLPAVP